MELTPEKRKAAEAAVYLVKLKEIKNKNYQKLVEYVIKPTDTVRNIAVAFRMDLLDLIRLNPEVVTPFPQAGIKLMLPVDSLKVQETPEGQFKISLAKCEFYITDKIQSGPDLLARYEDRLNSARI
jgi:hypothetical protein